MGGVEQVIHQIAAGCVRKGLDVDVLSISGENRFSPITIDGVSIYKAKQSFEVASTPFSWSAFRVFSGLAESADLIHYHFPWPFMDVVHLAKRVKKPALVTYHSDIVRQMHLLRAYRPLMNCFLGSADRIVATSPNYLASSDVLQRYSSKTSVIPIGLDRSSYPQATSEKLAFWREKLGPRFFLFIGVIRYYKGLHILMEAARGASFPIVIVGAGPIEVELKAHAKELGLTNVHFLGYLPDEDKVALLTLCCGVVFPSHLRSEAFGVSLLEGAMYGKPMISSEIGTGTTYINIAGETGLVVPPSDSRALLEAMRHLWENPGSAAEMGRRAEGRYRELFTADRMVDAYVRLYENMTPA